MSALFDTAILNRVEHGPSFAVERERIAAYAAATNDPAADVRAGDVAPPVFAFVPLRPVVRTLLKQTTPLYDQLRGLHGEQDIRLHRPITPGMRLSPSGEVIGIRCRSTGVSVIMRLETEDAAGGLVSEYYTTIFFPGATLDESVGKDAPTHRLTDDVKRAQRIGTVTQRFDHDQPARYAAASGDTGKYHLDANAARAVGLPGVIVHGMCSLAFAGHAVLGHVANGDPRRARRLAVRLAKPVRPGTAMETSIWQIADRTFAFESKNDDGQVVLTHGRLSLE